MQIQRTILWIIFSMSLLFLWDNWQRHDGKPTMFGQSKPVATQAADGGGGKPGEKPSTPQAGSGADSAVPNAAVAPATVPAAGSQSTGAPATTSAPAGAGRMLTLENDVLRLSIGTVGAVVHRAELLQHKEIDSRDVVDTVKAAVLGGPKARTDLGNVVLLSDNSKETYIAQTGLIGAPTGASFPTHRVPMQVAAGPARNDGQSSVTLVAESGGVKLTRRYTLEPGSYVLKVRDEVANVSDKTVSPTQYMQLTRDDHKAPGDSKFYSTYTGPVVYNEEGKFQKVSFDHIAEGKKDFERKTNDGWVGMIQHYFASAWIPAEKLPREFYGAKVGDKLYSIGIKSPIGEIAPGASVAREMQLYVGPQDQRVLEKLAPGLDLTVDYGWLTAVAKPIYWLLEQLHKVVGNWGWAIVLLTLIIKTLFFPLQAASYRSMARMKAVTPRLQAMRERYGEDRAKLNQAMMELYKQEKINPLGGCLPIVVQIPVFIALYWVLLASVEMRNAPWLGWITNLAAPDQYGILPLIMAASMFVQTMLNPKPPDPVQAKMMTLMPIVFSVMFFFFPAGLVLYWLVNNLYSIAQQWVITKKINAPKS
ncbi:MAG: membrane protein insertase YidC [Burkholderiaceae bacterium]